MPDRTTTGLFWTMLLAIYVIGFCVIRSLELSISLTPILIFQMYLARKSNQKLSAIFTVISCILQSVFIICSPLLSRMPILSESRATEFSMFGIILWALLLITTSLWWILRDMPRFKNI